MATCRPTFSLYCVRWSGARAEWHIHGSPAPGELHRLNVVTSRARALAIIVASPDLARVACRTPRQMHLANALCHAREIATSTTTEARSRLVGQPRLAVGPAPFVIWPAIP